MIWKTPHNAKTSGRPPLPPGGPPFFLERAMISNIDPVPPEDQSPTLNLQAQFATYTRTCVELLSKNKETLFEALAAAGITAAIVFFDGSGDEGQIESIEAKNGDEPVEFPERKIEFAHAVMDQLNQTTLTVQAETFHEAITWLVYAYLGQVQQGWDTGEGAYGYFRFDVAARTISLDFNERFIDSENSTYEF
jgi:hypothetical protein